MEVRDVGVYFLNESCLFEEFGGFARKWSLSLRIGFGTLGSDTSVLGHDDVNKNKL